MAGTAARPPGSLPPGPWPPVRPAARPAGLRRCGFRAGVTTTAASLVSGEVTAATDSAPGQRPWVIPDSLTRGCAIGQVPTSRISWERCRRRPARPSARTAKRTRVRQPRPPESPGRGSTVTSRSRPAIRRSCWAMTAALNRRCAVRLACCQSHPPQPPGWACGHGGSTRSGEASRISTASARASLAVDSVSRASTRSPGSVCRTRTTRPPGSRATHQPPCATSPTASSSSWSLAGRAGSTLHLVFSRVEYPDRPSHQLRTGNTVGGPP